MKSKLNSDEIKSGNHEGYEATLRKTVREGNQ